MWQWFVILKQIMVEILVLAVYYLKKKFTNKKYFLRTNINNKYKSALEPIILLSYMVL